MVQHQPHVRPTGIIRVPRRFGSNAHAPSIVDTKILVQPDRCTIGDADTGDIISGSGGDAVIFDARAAEYLYSPPPSRPVYNFRPTLHYACRLALPYRES